MTSLMCCRWPRGRPWPGSCSGGAGLRLGELLVHPGGVGHARQVIDLGAARALGRLGEEARGVGLVGGSTSAGRRRRACRTAVARCCCAATAASARTSNALVAAARVSRAPAVRVSHLFDFVHGRPVSPLDQIAYGIKCRARALGGAGWPQTSDRRSNPAAAPASRGVPDATSRTVANFERSSAVVRNAFAAAPRRVLEQRRQCAPRLDVVERIARRPVGHLVVRRSCRR